MKSIEVCRKQDINKFQLDFATAFIEDISRISETKDSNHLSTIIYQLICSLIDAMTVASFRVSQDGVVPPKMRIELHILPSGGLQFQVVPLDLNGVVIKTDKEMPSIVVGASPEETKQFMAKKGSTQLFLMDKLPKEN
jgi:hypothetical protein